METPSGAGESSAVKSTDCPAQDLSLVPSTYNLEAGSCLYFQFPVTSHPLLAATGSVLSQSHENNNTAAAATTTKPTTLF